MDVQHRGVYVGVIHDFLNILEIDPSLCRSCAERVTARAMKGNVRYPRIAQGCPPRGLDVF